METRKKIFGAECLFTALIAVYEVVTVLALFTDLFSGITIKQNILFSQSLIFVPTVLYLFIMRKHVKDIIWFRRFHPLTLLLIPPLVLFMEPLITLLNAISMLFVRNEISNAASALVDHNTLGTSLFFMAFLPCVIEELAYRGVMFGSFHEAGRLKAILMSGFLFGLMHMNFNQMAYAVVIGLIFGCVIAVLTALSFNREIKKLQNATHRVAGGDFSEKIKVTRSDEFGVLETNFNGMMDDVSGLIHAVEDKSNHILEVAGGISEVAGNTKTTIEQVTQAIDSVAQGAVKQAESTQEANTEVEHLKNMRQKNMFPA